MTARQITADSADLRECLALIRTAFAGMEGRIDPPSSVHLLTHESLREEAARGDLWAIGTPVRACVILTPKADALYIGKLAVAQAHRNQGLARQLIALAEQRAAAQRLPALELQTRVELTENHATFAALGFHKTGATAHAGYDRPTSVTYRKPVGST